MQVQPFSLATKLTLIKHFPCFSALSLEQSYELATLMTEMHVKAQDTIVVENELIESIFIIASGEAEVFRQIQNKKKVNLIPLAKLGAGEGIGLSDTGFYSVSGKRTATVKAITDMVLFRLSIQDLHHFLEKNQLENIMYTAAKEMQRMNFIKQSLPFAKLSPARLKWLANHVEERKVTAGTIIFNQGEKGDSCYLIYSGQVEISITTEGITKRVTTLKPPVLFGEATLITNSPRNATAIALEDCELLVLKKDYLSELMANEKDVADMFMTLMVDRSRPLQNPHVSIHKRVSADGQPLTILKNPDNGSYFKLSKEGAFIWQQLNGKQTIQEITLDLAQKYNVFAPDMVVGLIAKLTKAGFINNLTLEENTVLASQPLWVRWVIKSRKLLEFKFSFGDADNWVSIFYKRFIHYFFTKIGQVLLAILALSGLMAFIYSTPHILQFFSAEQAGLLLIAALIPLGILDVVLHELGHAFTVKACGREVHYMGVGWYWFAPIAFTDTSDMWLSPRKPRILVNLAGIYVDILVAAISALLAFTVANPYLQGLFWLFALYTYLTGFRNLNPLQDMDGYYALMDAVEKNHLRESAVKWLVNDFPKALKNPRLFRNHKPEVIYWLACLSYLIAISIITLLLQLFVLTIFGIKPNLYLSLILPFLIAIFSSLNIIAEIRHSS